MAQPVRQSVVALAANRLRPTSGLDGAQTFAGLLPWFPRSDVRWTKMALLEGF